MGKATTEALRVATPTRPAFGWPPSPQGGGIRKSRRESPPDGRHQPAAARCPRSFGGVSPWRRHVGRGRPYFVRDQTRRVRGVGRRIRLGQVGQRAVDPETAAVSDRVASQWQHPFQGPRADRSAGERYPLDPRQRHLDHLPGTDDVAQPAAHHRGPDRRDPAAAWRRARQRGAGADSRIAHPGRDSRSREQAQELSASVEWRPAPARHDCDGARQRAGPVDRG